jgi:hypothetical protein
MGRRIGRGLRSLLVTALLGAASAPPLAAQPSLTHDAPTRPRSSYPTNEEILPFWMALLRMDQASVYRVGRPRDLTLLDEGRDSIGVIAGCPILETARVVGEDWVDSLRTIVGNRMSYRREPPPRRGGLDDRHDRSEGLVSLRQTVVGGRDRRLDWPGSSEAGGADR